MKRNSTEIAAAIRQRICLSSEPGDMLLHEGQLAVEFGVSRTPIRQVLQMLAYESLVETRSGIGTIVSPLLSERREQDAAAFHALIGAAAACPPTAPEAAATARLHLVVARRQLDGEETRAEQLYQVLSNLLEAVAVMAGDHILSSALRAAFWRHIRWRIASLPEGQKRAIAAQERRALRELVDRMILLAEAERFDELLRDLSARGI